MNAITPSQPTKLDQFRMEILPPERKAELVSGLPRHVNAERFERNLVNALMQNSDLLQCDPRLIFREVSKAGALGLYLDPQLGEAYLIVGWNSKAKRKEPQLRIGYRGLIKLGRQSGDISQIYSHEVHQNDVFKAVLGDEKRLVHEPDIFGDRGPIVGYYAVVKYKNGDTDFEPLTIAQAHAIRDRSDGWKAFKEGKIKSTPWATDETEMSKKTAIRRLVKRIPQSPELADAIKIEDAADHAEATNNVMPAPPRPPAPPAYQIQPAQSEPASVETIEESEAVDNKPAAEGVIDVDPETGEIVDGEVEQVVDEPAADDQPSTEQPSEPESDGDYFDRLEAALLAAKTVEDLEESWNEADPLAKFDGDETSQGIAAAIKKRALKKLQG